MAKEGKEKFVRAVLTLFAAFLTFGGPTYLLYALQRFALPKPLLILLGLAAFTVGIILFAYLSKGEGKGGTST